MYELSNELYFTEWETLPVELQKYLTMAIPLTQKKRILTGYGILDCTFATFASVFHIMIIIFYAFLKLN